MVRYLKFVLLLGLAVSLVTGSLLGAPGDTGVNVISLRCEYDTNPLGVDTPAPRFSWIVQSENRGVAQTAYQILVASSLVPLENNTGDLWDSGKINSAQSVNVVYDGKQLRSGQKYYWKVRVWDEDNQPTPYSKSVSFQMGMLHASDWQGEWIGAPDTSITAPLLRKGFRINKPIKSAYASIVGLGYYEMYFNGSKVGKHVLDPGTTEYDKRILYETYDVSDYLKSGPNAVGVMLGMGYFNHRTTIEYGKQPVLRLQLNITYTDGSTDQIVSDRSWKASAGPIQANSVYDGEIYDARQEKPGWSTADFNDRSWSNAVRVTSPGGKLESQLMPAIKVTKTLRPVKLMNPEPGVYVFDFGQNMTGWPRLYVHGPAGTKVTLQSAEITNRDMANMRDTAVVGNPELVDTSPNRSAKARDIYVLKGADGAEVYEPRFTYHGYRYVQVEGFPGTPDLTSLEARVVHSAVKPVGQFSSSNILLDQTHENTLWGQVSNLFSMPTDCPQRDERMGWMGDAHLTAVEAMYNFDMANFYTNWLRDIQVSQQDSGFVPDVVPHHKYSIKGTPAWQVAYPLVTWYTYQSYGDTRILKEHYDSLARWLQYMGETADGYIVRWGRGDWVPPKTGYQPQDGSVPITSTGYYYRSAEIMANMAEILGKSADARKYQRLAENIKAAFNKEFLNTSTHQYGSGSQTCNAFPLYLGMVPDDQEEGVVHNLVQDIMQQHDGHLSTGILGTKALVEALPAYGHSDVMYTVATRRTFPGWGYMLSKGATTLWERWGGYRYFGPRMNSLNHIMFGSVDEFFYRDLAGINPVQPAYAQIVIQPHVLGDLTSAQASVNTIRGKVASAWQTDGYSISLTVTIPGNSQAVVNIPKMGLADVQVEESGVPVFTKGSYSVGTLGITAATEHEDYVSVNVGSGTYHFVLSGTPGE